jgi:hypothetical protein
MAGCQGTLVVHEDGTPIWCSEELDGNTCTDDAVDRHRALISCRVAFRLGCPDCRHDEPAGWARAAAGIAEGQPLAASIRSRVTRAAFLASYMASSA